MRILSITLLVIGVLSWPACLEEMPAAERDASTSDAAIAPVDDTLGGDARPESASDAPEGDPSPGPERCLEAQPAALTFHGVEVGSAATQTVELRACGEQPTTIEGLALDPTPGFELQAPALPVTLSPDETLSLELTYAPIAPAPALTATLEVISDAPTSPLELAVSAEATAPPAADCPTAAFSIAEGLRVPPQTTLHLDAHASASPIGASLTHYRWRVEQPAGSRSVLHTATSEVRPTFTANVVGAYRFTLELQDANGTLSCATAERTVIVEPESALHIELLWRTPGDPDETDEGNSPRGESLGADLDLHFVKVNDDTACDDPAAPLPDPDRPETTSECWFNDLWDVCWLNSSPIWDGGASGGPRLARDDTDGAGPELLDYDDPAPGSYLIGVHVWNDWGFGESWASVRIFINGQLRTSVGEVPLQHRAFWWVGTLKIPEMTFTPAPPPEHLPPAH